MLWDEIIEKSKQMNMQYHHVFQEEAQKAILTALSRERLFNHMVFQGGTALRLFYGNPRFSEDLDFVLRQTTSSVDFTDSIKKIERFVHDIFPFLNAVSISVQKKDFSFQRFIVKTNSEYREQKLRIHLEIAMVSSYDNQSKILVFPPFNPAVRVEDGSEILSDKIVALGRRSYLKGRDLWDIYFLQKEKNMVILWDQIIKKVDEYGDTYELFLEKLSRSISLVENEGISILIDEMKRFLPPQTFEYYYDMFPSIISSLCSDIKSGLNQQR